MVRYYDESIMNIQIVSNLTMNFIQRNNINHSIGPPLVHTIPESIDEDEPITLFWQKDGVLLLESKSKGIIMTPF